MDCTFCHHTEETCIPEAVFFSVFSSYSSTSVIPRTSLSLTVMYNVC